MKSRNYAILLASPLTGSILQLDERLLQFTVSCIEHIGKWFRIQVNALYDHRHATRYLSWHIESTIDAEKLQRHSDQGETLITCIYKCEENGDILTKSLNLDLPDGIVSTAALTCSSKKSKFKVISSTHRINSLRIRALFWSNIICRPKVIKKPRFRQLALMSWIFPDICYTRRFISSEGIERARCWLLGNEHAGGKEKLGGRYWC